MRTKLVLSLCLAACGLAPNADAAETGPREITVGDTKVTVTRDPNGGAYRGGAYVLRAVRKDGTKIKRDVKKTPPGYLHPSDAPSTVRKFSTEQQWSADKDPATDIPVSTRAWDNARRDAARNPAWQRRIVIQQKKAMAEAEARKARLAAEERALWPASPDPASK